MGGFLVTLIVVISNRKSTSFFAIMRVLRRFRACPGRLVFGERVAASPPEGAAHGAALGLGCCAVVAQRGHHCCRSEWCKQACKTRLSVHCLRGRFFFSMGGRRPRRCAWMLLRGADTGAAGHLSGSSQDTRRDLALSSVFLKRFLLLLFFLGVRFDCRESAVFLCAHRSNSIDFGGRGRLLLNGELSMLFLRHPC